MGRVGFVGCLSVIWAVSWCGGCATPSRQFSQSNWICNTKYVDALSPGDLVYMRQGRVMKVSLPDEVGGFDTMSSAITAHHATGNNNWDFFMDWGVEGLPGSGTLSDTQSLLKSVGIRRIEYLFTDTTLKSLRAAPGGQPAENVTDAKALAEAYLNGMTPRDWSAISQSVRGNSVYIVTQVLESGVDANFEGNSSLEPNAPAVVQSIAMNLAPTTTGAEAKHLSIHFPKPLPIAYRAIPLSVGGKRAGDSESGIHVRTNAKFAGPRNDAG